MKTSTILEKITIRDALFDILDTQPFCNDSFLTALNAYSSAQIDLVISDILANMRRGQWRESTRWLSRPSGGNALFYQTFPQEALMALLRKASPNSAIEALNTALSSWKRRWPHNVLACLICYRSLRDIREIVAAFPSAVSLTLCENLKTHIAWMGTDGAEKWWTLFNLTPIEGNYLLAYKREAIYHETAHYTEIESPLDEFLTTHHTSTPPPLTHLNDEHLALLFQWTTDNYALTPHKSLRNLAIDILVLERLNPSLKHRLGYLILLYSPEDLDTAFASLLKLTIGTLQQVANEQTGIQRLFRKMIAWKAPVSHWQSLLKGVMHEELGHVFTSLMSEPALKLLRYDPKYLFHLLFAWAGSDKKLATALCAKVFQSMQFISNDTASAAEILEIVQHERGWEVFAEHWQAKFPDMTTQQNMIKFSDPEDAGLLLTPDRKTTPMAQLNK